MAVLANLVIGQDGSTTSSGSSAKLSSQEDRRRFHKLRERADVIFIGGNTARNEPYQQTPKPLLVVSKSTVITELSNNDKSEIINLDPTNSLKYAKEKYGDNVLIEGGPTLLLEVIGEVDELYITIANRNGDGQIVSFDGLTRNFVMENMEKIEDEIFYKFMKLK